MIKLQITKYEDNKNYESEMLKIKEERVYGMGHNFESPMTQREVAKGLLDVYITEEQFNAIRKAVLEVF